MPLPQVRVYTLNQDQNSEDKLYRLEKGEFLYCVSNTQFTSDKRLLFLIQYSISGLGTASRFLHISRLCIACAINYLLENVLLLSRVALKQCLSFYKEDFCTICHLFFSFFINKTNPQGFDFIGRIYYYYYCRHHYRYVQ